MAQIVNVLGDNALRLQNEELVRALPWGADWRRIRICMNLSMPALGGSAGFTAALYMGLCQGTVNTFKSASCTEWVGGFVSGTAIWAGASPGVWWGAPNPQDGYKKNSVLTTTNTGGAANFINKNMRWAWQVEISTAATGYAVLLNAPGTQPTSDLTGSNFMLSTVGGESYTLKTVAMTTNYALDTLSIYWDCPSVGIDFNEIEVVRMA